MQFRTYIYTLLIGAALLVGANVGLTWLVDPYGLYDSEISLRIAPTKPRALNQLCLAKVSRFGRSHARGLVLGNSRFDIGLNPASAQWPVKARPIFNLAVPGQGIVGMAQMLNTMDATGDGGLLDNAEVVVLGLELFDFSRQVMTQNIAEETIKAFAPRCQISLNNLLAAHLSITALVDSVVTVTSQNDPHALTMNIDGFNPFHQTRNQIATEGHHAIAEHALRSYFRQIQAFDPQDILNARDSVQMQAVDAVINRFGRAGVPLHAIIYPYHADILEGIERAGLWPAFEAWKIILARRFANARQVRHYDVHLWDFSGYTTQATESFPLPGDTSTEMTWYWEPGHFKETFGNQILQRIFDPQAATPDGDNLLTPDMIDGHNRRMREAQSAYRKAKE